MKISGMENWERIALKDLALYVLADEPDWFVASKTGDRLLQQVSEEGTLSVDCDSPVEGIRLKQFLSILPKAGNASAYPGRASLLHLTELREFWFHVTDQCNLACRHCLFSCKPTGGEHMPLDRFSAVLDEVHALGGRTFYFTGGEPLIHPDIETLCRKVLEKSSDTHLVILTNGIRIPEMEDAFNGLPLDRLHFQLSIDGNSTRHEALRGKGTFGKLEKAMTSLKRMGADTTLAMAVHRDNLSDMPAMVDIAADKGVTNIHYLWLFVTGSALPEQFSAPEEIFPWLKKSYESAQEKGISIDNVETLKSQVFSVPGTRHDGSNAGWESLAMAPDGSIFPTPALMHAEGAFAGNADQGIETVWRKSLLLDDLRSTSVASDAALKSNPFRYIIGGGDPDHSFYSSGRFCGRDPYEPLYRMVVLMLIEEHVVQNRFTVNGSRPSILARMGERLENCDYSDSGVALTHSNCVLSMAGARKKVETFYANAAENPEADTDILNPVCYPDHEITHIPGYARVRSFGCGSPVMDARVLEGETVVDLGSGTGVECFIASKMSGASGRVIGIDMTDTMLSMATRAAVDVSQSLGYANTSFIKGFLEDIPLADDTVDAVISNCVINLSSDKARTLSEVYRILKPGGRLMISDVVTDTRPSPKILNDPELRGECIAGAMVQEQLVNLLENLGFETLVLKKRFFYREVQGHLFHSLTYSAVKPVRPVTRDVVYPGPFASVVTDSGEVLVRGQVRSLEVTPALADDPSLFVLDELGNVEGLDAANCCSCYVPPETDTGENQAPEQRRGDENDLPAIRSMMGCMVCASPLRYLDQPEQGACHFCGGMFQVDARCGNSHFVCNACHSRDTVEVVKTICTTTRERDMITLINTIRNHPNVPLHGPEHHFIVPGVILAAYRNSGGILTDDQIIAGIDRGRAVPGGTCAFWGACGAVTGAGIAMGIAIESTPLKADARQLVQKTVADLIREVSSISAARCCQRETWKVLEMMAHRSMDLLGVFLSAAGPVTCRQKRLNRECAGKACPYF